MSISITTTINDTVKLFRLTKVADDDVVTRLRDVLIISVDKINNKTGFLAMLHLNNPSSCKPFWRRYVTQDWMMRGILLDLLHLCSYCNVCSSDWPNIAANSDNVQQQ